MMSGGRKMFSAYRVTVPENIDREETVERLLALLSPERRAFITETKKNPDGLLLSCVASRLFEKKASFITAVPVSDLTYKYEKNGKPSLGFDSDISFSMSHAKNTVAVVINYNEDRGPAPSCGIDIEEIAGAKEKAGMHMKAADRFFGETERGYIGGADGDEQLVRFLEIYTAKEAHAKMTGEGIFREISQKDLFIPKDDGNHVFSDGRHLSVYRMPDAVISVAVDEPFESMPYDFIEVDFDDLFGTGMPQLRRRKDYFDLDNPFRF